MQDITVIVPAYNHEEYIAAAMLSVIKQSVFSESWVIVSDDCSTDSTASVARDAASAYPSIAVRKTNRNLGVIAHYRELMSLVTTPYVAILEGDDTWISELKLEHQRAMMRSFPDMGVCFSACIVNDERRRNSWPHPSWNAGRDRLFDVIDLIYNNDIGTFSNCMYRSEALRAALDDEKATVGYDWLCNLIIGATSSIGFIAEPSTAYRIHSKGTWTSVPLNLRAGEMIRTLEAFKAHAGHRLRAYVDDAIARLAQ